MPIAVITSQINSRIKAQKGHFVAYNLQVNYTKKNVGEITNLYNLQEEMYRILRNRGEDFYPFIAKIIIPLKYKSSLYELLLTYGINKSIYYPELMNIGTDISKMIYKK